MVYENCKVYGPYKRKDGRSHVVLVYPDGRKKTVSYPKFLTENRINRYFLPNETVDHLNNNFNENEEKNIRIIERVEHIIDDVVRHEQKAFICPECGVKFFPKDMHDAVQARKKNKAGPFCSRHCVGKYGKKVQLGAEKLKVELIKPSYTTNKLSRQKETSE